METICGPNKARELLQMLQQDNPIQISEQNRACQKWMHHLIKTMKMWILQHAFNS